MAQEHTAAQRATLGLCAGVADGVGNRRRAGFLAGQGHGHGHVAGTAGEGIGVQGEAVGTGLQQRCGRACRIATAALQVQLARYTALGIKLALLRDAVVDDIHNTAHGAATVHQRAGTTQHLDAFHGDGVGRHGVVIAQARGIDACTAVLQDTHTVTVQPADDGAAGIGAKVAAADAGCAIQRLTQRALGA